MLIHRRRARPRRGGAAVELALCAPVLFILIFGHIEMIRMGMVTQLMTTAAREGCRVAVIDQSGTGGVAAVRSQVKAVLQGSGVPITDSQITILNADNGTALTLNGDAPMGTPILVSLSISYGSVSWLPAAGYLGNPTLQASATMSSERQN